MTAAPRQPRRTGRPRVDAMDRRTDAVRVRLTAAERAAVDARAAQAGLSVSDFARLALLGAKIEPPRSAGAVPPLLVTDLARIGNNLNQLAKSAHVGRELRGLAETTLAELRGLVVAITDQLDR